MEMTFEVRMIAGFYEDHYTQKTITRSFDNYADAEKFNDNIQRIMRMSTVCDDPPACGKPFSPEQARTDAMVSLYDETYFFSGYFKPLGIFRITEEKLPMKGITFAISPEDCEKIDAWKNEQDKKVIESQKGTSLEHTGEPYYGCSGGAYVYSFCATSLGMTVKVRNDLTKEELDLTDYDSW